MNKYKKLYLAFLILFLFTGCDDNDGDSEETFRFFDELDFVNDSSLSHDPADGIHLSFVEPPESELLEIPEGLAPVAGALAAVGLDNEISSKGVDHHIYDITEPGIYTLEIGMEPIGFPKTQGKYMFDPDLSPIAVIADANTGELVAAVRVGLMVYVEFNLNQGSVIGITTTERWLKNALDATAEKNLVGCPECGIVQGASFLAAPGILEDHTNVVWSDELFGAGGNSRDLNLIKAAAAGPVDITLGDLPQLIAERDNAYQIMYADAFGFEIPQQEVLEEANENGYFAVRFGAAPAEMPASDSLAGFSEDELDVLGAEGMAIAAGLAIPAE